MRRNQIQTAGVPEIQSVSSIKGRKLRWIWNGRIPQGKLTILSGDPNLGKSFLTMDLAARVSTGRAWPDGEAGCEAGKVLLLSAEDDVADTIRPRLNAAGANLQRIHVLERMRREGCTEPEKSQATSSRPVLLHDDVDAIGEALRRDGGYRMVIVDPISAYLDDLNQNDNSDVRRLLSRLAELAEACDVAVVIVSHHNKGGQHAPAVYRTIGSLAFTAVARSLWSVVKDAHDAERRLLVPVKMNLVRNPLGMAFRLVEPGRVEWEPEPLYLDADEKGENAFADTDGTDRQKMAKEWLHALLYEKRLPSNEVKQLSRERGINNRTLWEAKKELGVKAIREGSPGVWYWELPWGMQMVMPGLDG